MIEVDLFGDFLCTTCPLIFLTDLFFLPVYVPCLNILFAVGIVFTTLFGSINPDSYLFLIGIAFGIRSAVAVGFRMEYYYKNKDQNANKSNATKDKNMEHNIAYLKKLYDDGIITKYDSFDFNVWYINGRNDVYVHAENEFCEYKFYDNGNTLIKVD